MSIIDDRWAPQAHSLVVDRYTSMWSCIQLQTLLVNAGLLVSEQIHVVANVGSGGLRSYPPPVRT